MQTNQLMALQPFNIDNILPLKKLYFYSFYYDVKIFYFARSSEIELLIKPLKFMDIENWINRSIQLTENIKRALDERDLDLDLASALPLVSPRSDMLAQI